MGEISVLGELRGALVDEELGGLNHMDHMGLTAVRARVRYIGYRLERELLWGHHSHADVAQTPEKAETSLGPRVRVRIAALG